MNTTRMARLMAERHGGYSGAMLLNARADYYAGLVEMRMQDHRKLTRNDYAFRAMYWRSASRVCIAKYAHVEAK